MKNHFFLLFLSLFICDLNAQEVETPRILNVYLDAFAPPYYTQDLRAEFPYVNYTAKVTEGDVQVFLLTEDIGFGQGRQAYIFIGMREFNGKNDTIWFISTPNMTELELKNQSIEAFKTGIYPYLKSKYQGNLAELIGERPEKNEDVSWNKTVYNVSLGGNWIKEKTQKMEIGGPFIGVNSKESSLNYNINSTASFLHLGEKWRFDGGLKLNIALSKQNTVIDTLQEL
jgi:hypothetical protein